jgi:hypothetical protein
MSYIHSALLPSQCNYLSSSWPLSLKICKHLICHSPGPFQGPFDFSVSCSYYLQCIAFFLNSTSDILSYMLRTLPLSPQLLRLYIQAVCSELNYFSGQMARLKSTPLHSTVFLTYLFNVSGISKLTSQELAVATLTLILTNPL